jgi:hypothetical protein
MIDRFSIVTLVNSDDTYSRQRRSLQRQSRFQSLEFLPVFADKRGWSASIGLNRGIDLAGSEWIICVHQDVIFPDCWLEYAVPQFEETTNNAAIIGLVGIRRDGTFAGHVKDPHGHRKWPPLPSAVISIDEHLMVLRKSAGIRFDEEAPGFHLYGTDICLTAQARGLGSVVIDAPVVHLSHGKVEETFRVSADWLLAKWGREMRGVIPTCSAIICEDGVFGQAGRQFIKLKRWLRSGPTECTCDRVSHSEVPQS